MSTEREVFLKIFAHSKDSVFLLDPASKKILFANPKSEEDTSYESAELEGLDFAQLFLEEDRAAIGTLLETTLQWKTGVDPERLLRRKTGRKITVEMTTSVVDWDDGVAVFCNVRDISERVKARAELETLNAELEDRVRARTAELAAQKLQLDDMMDHIQQAIFTVSPELTINTEHSRFVREVFGLDEVAGQAVDAFLGVDAAVASVIRDSLALIFTQPETWEMVVELLPREIVYHGERDLTLEWVAMRETTDAEAPIVKVMVICQDVTERKKLQAQVAQQQATNQERMDTLAKMLSLPAGMVGGFVGEITRLAQDARAQLTLFQEHSDDAIARNLMRSLHTLKGALAQLRIKSAATIAHGLESLVQDRLATANALARLARARVALGELRGERAETLQFRVDTQERELQARLDRYSQQTDAHLAQLSESLTELDAFYTRVFGGRSVQQDATESLPLSAERVSALLDQEEFRAPLVRRGVQWMLQAPVSGLFARLESVVRSAAQDLGREWVLEQNDAEIEIDRRLMSPLYDALLHVVRNSVDHGGAGRSTPLKLTWTAARVDAHSVAITLTDDGNGIDVEKVRAKAVEKKLKTQAEADAADDASVLRWIFLPGLSTQDQVTEISGRGVGMDQVLQVIERQCGGQVQVQSEKGKGTQVSVKIPRELPQVTPAHLAFPTEDAALGKLLAQVFGAESLSAVNPANPEVTPLWVERPQLPSPSAPLTHPDQRGPAKRSLFLAPLDHAEPAFSTLSRFFGEERGKASHLLSTPESFSRFGGGWLRAWNRSEAWSSRETAIASILDPGSTIREHRLRDYALKSQTIDAVVNYAESQRGFAGLPELVGVACEELIMNAMFDAPRDSEGKSKYNHLPRTHALVLEESETVTLRYGADAQLFCVSITDPAGALSIHTVREYLLRCLKMGADQVENKAGGAGLGLYTLFNSANGLVISVTPGRSTEVCVAFALCRSHKEYELSGRALSFMTRI